MSGATAFGALRIAGYSVTSGGLVLNIVQDNRPLIALFAASLIFLFVMDKGSHKKRKRRR